jgi:hypothetical protein
MEPKACVSSVLKKCPYLGKCVSKWGIVVTSLPSGSETVMLKNNESRSRRWCLNGWVYWLACEHERHSIIPRVYLRKFRHRGHHVHDGACTTLSSPIDRCCYENRRRSRPRYRHDRQPRQHAECPPKANSGRSGRYPPRNSATRVLSAATSQIHEGEDHQGGQIRSNRWN